MLARQVPQRQILFRTIGRVFTGLSDTAKAFLIILTTGAPACREAFSRRHPAAELPVPVGTALLSGLSPPAPADILLGYHSEEGWTAFLRIFSGHYGLEAEVRLPAPL